ncbi:glycosyltransferase family A protein [Sphingobacterium faecale]|uniref:Glycosyltransferase family 2 protein n=1 Tax=Sphingobacterium faecale TaxID=2803775 RepID=A0ABS1QZE3_9SPHI|nr:glycosyltransferase family A protein [Sphingobacterium faecale]MBL1407806.1 glycosyltransferase family 2 protein [Sphingobacterium faecale]
MLRQKLVSVIIPAYNAQNTIIDCLQSVENQLYKNIEVILIDDGSIDKTFETALAFKSLNPNMTIELFSQSNRGPSAARNEGLRCANGEFVVFLDSDDKLDSSFIEKCLINFENNPTLNLVYSGVRQFGRESKDSYFGDFSLNRFLRTNVIPVFAMVRRSHLLAVGGFDENLRNHEDWELWIRIISQYGPFVCQIKEPLYHYRKRIERDSITDKTEEGNNIEMSYCYIYKKHYEFYFKNGFGIYDLLVKSKYEEKYYNTWYRKLFYRLKRKN